MIHLIWCIVVGLIAGVIAKSAMHVHMTVFWTIVLGIIGSIIGSTVTHLFRFLDERQCSTSPHVRCRDLRLIAST